MKYTTSLTQNRDFRRMYAKADNKAGSAVVVYAWRNRRPGNRMGITVSTKIGNAVIRNRARRRIKECYRLNEDKLKSGYDIVIVSRTRAVTIPYAVLDKELLRLFRELGLLRHPTPIITHNTQNR